MTQSKDDPIRGLKMSWQQAYNAQFAKPLVNQIIAIIQRDQAAALSVINAARTVDGNQPLAPIAEFHKGPGTRTGWPWTNLEIGPTNFNRGDDKATRHHEVRINLALDSGQYDQEMAQEDAQRLRAPARHDHYQRRTLAVPRGLDRLPAHSTRDGAQRLRPCPMPREL